MEETQISNTNNKEVAAAYIRVSTERQKDEGYSIKNQLDLAHEYANKHGWKLPTDYIFQENGSASKIYGDDVDTDDFPGNFFNRPEFKKLLSLAETKDFKHLIVYSRDRLTRDLHQYITLELFLKGYEIDVHFTRVGENIKNENPALSHFINIILSSYAEYESSLLSTRIKDANKTCILDGHWAGGRTPFGYIRKYVNGNTFKKHTTLLKSDFESLMVNEIFNLALLGYGSRKISNIMNKKYSFIKWTKSKIEAILNNQTYTGYITWNRRGGRRQKYRKYNDLVQSSLIKDAVIIDKNTWDTCLDKKAERNKNRDPYYHITPFILKDKLKCSKGKCIMKTKNPGKNKSNIYRCNSRCSEECNGIISARKVHYHFAKKIKDFIKIDDYIDFWKEYYGKFGEKNQQYILFKKSLEEKINEYNSLLDKVNNRLKDEASSLIAKALKNQKINISKQINEYEKTKLELEKFLSVEPMNESTFAGFITNYISSLFDNFDIEAVDDEDKIDEQLIKNNHIVREFVLNFIDEVDIKFENGSIKLMNITYKAPEFT